jgi:LysM domain
MHAITVPAPRSAPRPNPRPAARATTTRPRAATTCPRAATSAPSRVIAHRRIVAFTVVAALALAAVGIGFGHASAEIEGPAPAPTVYVVQPGDTLWAIAAKVAPSVDTPRAVAALRGAAGTSSLTPGQRIVVPKALS